jgi:hypothetical protein
MVLRKMIGHAVVSQCCNPNCRRLLASVSEGRLYQFEIVSISISALDSNVQDFDEVPQREIANFWLCGPCSSSLTLTLEPEEGLRFVPIDGRRTPQPQFSELNDLGKTQDC